jgi:hypothetical protein
MLMYFFTILSLVSDASSVASYLLSKQATACTSFPSAPCCSVPPWDVLQYSWWMAEAGNEHGIEPLVIAAIAWHESKLISDAIGPSGHDSGLLQIVHHYVPESHEELLDPETNIQAGARVLAWWQSRPAYAEHYLAHYAGGVSPEARHYVFEAWVIAETTGKELPVFGGAP